MAVAVDVAVCVAVAVEVLEAVAVGVMVDVRVEVAVAVRVAVAVTVGVSVAVATRVAVAVAVGAMVGVDVRVGDAIAVRVGVALNMKVGVAVGIGTVEVGVGVGRTTCLAAHTGHGSHPLPNTAATARRTAAMVSASEGAFEPNPPNRMAIREQPQARGFRCAQTYPTRIQRSKENVGGRELSASRAGGPG